MSRTLLRRGVRVEESVAAVSLAYSFWTLDLPRGWVEATPGVAAVLAGHGAVEDLATQHPGLAGLIALLRGQGCLTFPDHETYSLREAGDLFHDISAAWYADYYAHPLWRRLRSGALSRNALVAWLLYNYQLSRSAGMSASRSAVRLADAQLRTVFAHSALEEYSHCEDYFVVSNPALPVSNEAVARSIHLPAGLAFDEQMLRMAEDDWLGHVLAALFQETTARFYSESRDFYRDVGAAYRLGDFFRNWERHIELDVNEDHADDFARLLDSDERVDKEVLVRSLQNVWLAFGCLLAGLDDILCEEREDNEIVLRLPIEAGRLIADDTALLRPYRGVLPPGERRIEAMTGIELHTQLCEAGLGSLPSGSDVTTAPPGSDVEFLRTDTALSIFRALSHARDHAELLVLGRLAEDAVEHAGLDGRGFEAADPPLSHHTVALANFLRERATQPIEFLYLLHHAGSLGRAVSARGGVAWLPIAEDQITERFLSETRIDATTADLLTNATLQLNELHHRWASKSGEAVVRNFLRD